VLTYPPSLSPSPSRVERFFFVERNEKNAELRRQNIFEIDRRKDEESDNDGEKDEGTLLDCVYYSL
jgi:hypothetical protein